MYPNRVVHFVTQKQLFNTFVGIRLVGAFVVTQRRKSRDACPLIKNEDVRAFVDDANVRPTPQTLNPESYFLNPQPTTFNTTP